MHLRPYQIEILDSIRKGWEQFTRQLVVSPTGSGKTICFSNLAAEFSREGLKTLILVDQEELVWQAIDKLEKSTGLKAEAEKAEHRASLSATVVVATIQTMIGRLDKWDKSHFGLVIADEADKSISDSWQTVLKHFNAKVCGFTATPWRTDKRSLGVFYENVAKEIGLFDLINQGYLSPIQVKMLPIQIDLSGVGMKGGDFDANDLDDAIEPHLMKVAEAIEEYAIFRKTMVFLPLIKTSQKFVEICQSIGLDAEHIDGKSEDRAEKLERFAKRDFQIISNSALLTRGYDDPGIDCVVMLRPTKSTTLYSQCIGRGTRIAPHKENLLLLDFLFATQKHRLCRPAHLIASTDEEADAITELAQERSDAKAYGDELDLGALAGDAVAKREEALRKRLAEAAKKDAKFISAEEFAMKHDSFETAEFEPTMEWEMRPPTEKQMKYIKRAGIDPASVRGSVHASKLLSLHFRDQGVKLASPSAAAKIRAMPWIAEQAGISDMKTITAQQAGRFFATLKSSR